MVCCVAIIGMDNLALMILTISEVFCLTQKVVCRSANTGPYHRYPPVAEKTLIKKCCNLGSSYPVMSKMSTWPLYLSSEVQNTFRNKQRNVWNWTKYCSI